MKDFELTGPNLYWLVPRGTPLCIWVSIEEQNVISQQLVQFAVAET